jgi:hypothetical protein
MKSVWQAARDFGTCEHSMEARRSSGAVGRRIREIPKIGSDRL